MPYANNDGTRIYYEVEGDGPPVVLQHGRGGTLDGWRQHGYVEALRDEYRLILIDARGHGRSDKPHDAAAYASRRLAGDITSVLDALGIERAVYWGYSMGGRIGYLTMKWAPERFHGWIIGGFQPFGWGAEEERLTRRTQAEVFRQGMDAWILYRMAGEAQTISDASRAYWSRNDHLALAAIMEAMASEDLDMERVVETVDKPVLVYCATEDAFFQGAKRAGATFPNARFLALEGLDHGAGYARADLVLPQARQFLAEVAHVPG